MPGVASSRTGSTDQRFKLQVPKTNSWRPFLGFFSHLNRGVSDFQASSTVINRLWGAYLKVSEGNLLLDCPSGVEKLWWICRFCRWSPHAMPCHAMPCHASNLKTLRISRITRSLSHRWVIRPGIWRFDEAMILELGWPWNLYELMMYIRNIQNISVILMMILMCIIERYLLMANGRPPAQRSRWVPSPEEHEPAKEHLKLANVAIAVNQHLVDQVDWTCR